MLGGSGGGGGRGAEGRPKPDYPAPLRPLQKQELLFFASVSQFPTTRGKKRGENRNVVTPA